MKHTQKESADYFIKYDNTAPTSWITLLALIIVFAVTFTNQFVEWYIEDANQAIAEMHLATVVEAAEIIPEPVVNSKEVDRQLFLKELRFCESTNNDFKAGDSGKSVGPYQWQKPTLEDKLGKKVSYDEYYSIVTNYELIHKITYYTYFVEGESWRWKNCTNKINKQKTWNI